MKIKNNIKKLKAFTLLELMVIMSVMTVLVAALSPAFTGKEKYSGDVVWHYVGGDRNGNAFSNPYNSFLRSAFYIGIAPTKEQIDNILPPGFTSFQYSNQLKLSKLIIRPSDHNFGANQHQDQIEFRLSTDAANREDGLHVASLFNDGENLLLGGPYGNINMSRNENISFGNTAYGANAMSTIGSGNRNTAIGSYTLNSLSNHDDNTAVGTWYLDSDGDPYPSLIDSALIPENRTQKTTIVGRLNQGRHIRYSRDNTIIGDRTVDPGADNITVRPRNTIIGTNAAPRISSGEDNVIIGANAGYSLTTGSGNTIVGGGNVTPIPGWDGQHQPTNHNAIKEETNNAAGQYITSGSHNTIVGVNAGNAFAYNGGTGSNVTCIGYGSCPYLGNDIIVGGGGGGFVPLGEGQYINRMRFFTENLDAGAHVFIGGPPKAVKIPRTDEFPELLLSRRGYAVLEVHNIDSKRARPRRLDDINSMDDIPPYGDGFGDESVLINGNLIVRGQTYLGGVPNVMHTSSDNLLNPAVNFPLFGMTHDVITNLNDNSTRAFMAYDGTAPNTNYALGLDEHFHSDVVDDSSEYGYLEIYQGRSKITNGHMHCTCAPDYKSYDWTSSIIGPDGVPLAGEGEDSCNISVKNKKLAHMYYFEHPHSSSAPTLDRESVYNDMNMISGKGCYYHDNYLNRDINYYYANNAANDIWYSFNMAHGSGRTYDATTKSDVDAPDSCCPYINDVASDSRLKNIGEKFTAGLAEIKKLKIFNFTMKADRSKTPRVGVIAQDLARIFPNAVYKDSSGFHRIRWDEMFYAAINAIKEINSRVDALAQRVNKDVDRIQNLKHENEQLTQQLEKLAQELDALEKQKK